MTLEQKCGSYDLALNKSLKAGQSSTVKVGDQVTFTIKVTNEGTITANSYEITDHLPAQLELADSDWNTAANNTATITLDTVLAPGASTTVDITTKVVSLADKITNVAEISTDDNDDTDSTPGNNTPNQSEDDEDSAFVVPVTEICN